MNTPRLESLTRLLALERLPRTGWLLAGESAPTESIAAHSHGVVVLALCLCPGVSPALERAEVLTLCALHDLAEALLGDLPREAGELLPKGAKAAAEFEAATRLLRPLEGPRGALLAAFERYQAQASREARFAKLCDRLQLGLRAWTRQQQGALGLEQFRRGLQQLEADEFAPCAELRAELLAAW